ncbi:MAG: triphosphoribosyl-dephospho-CoA synthase [Methanomicrobia archaeon]|nr:triphosphoribosyl-dephospho-CoA synthase [Methanomicrobia archaeon]
MDEDDVARSAQLALLLEVSAYPKPGNVDRTHDFIDTSYEHFLASSVAVYPVLRAAAVRGRTDRTGVGDLVRAGVAESTGWQRGGNTHFGALLLLVPLAMAAGACERFEPEALKHEAAAIMRNTTTDDAIAVYQAFPKAKVKVRTDVPEFDVTDESSIAAIKKQQLTLYELLSISASYDLISRELVGGFELTFKYAALIADFAKTESINDAITHADLHLLAEEEDTFITLKFGAERSRYVRARAQQIVSQGYKRAEIETFDNELVRERLNPGSTADIIAAALFISIFGGLRV